jgi:myo-inositol 2-dehydrogenase/D-chiro-inositol 1-dehydrogenase
VSGGLTVKLGIVGCGEVVAQGHAPALLANPAIQVVGPADPSPGRVETVAGALGLEAVPGFHDHRELLEHCELDAVLLATPPRLREAIVDDLAGAGVFVLCE